MTSRHYCQLRGHDQILPAQASGTRTQGQRCYLVGNYVQGNFLSLISIATSCPQIHVCLPRSTPLPLDTCSRSPMEVPGAFTMKYELASTLGLESALNLIRIRLTGLRNQYGLNPVYAQACEP